MSAPEPAAQYLRMSTEHQQYSLSNQSAAIQRYATLHDFQVVHTYSDAAKSGLHYRNRLGLQKLLKDVVAGQREYTTILVYDISRWGRFQDLDESAHYEFVCRSAGMKVVYCAEEFSRIDSPLAQIMKMIKRAIASEYSRDLSARVYQGQRRIAELGFWTGGEPGYGLRRMAVTRSGEPIGLLASGERKSLADERVVLVPGPPEEVECVKEIFGCFVEERWSTQRIADALNRRKILSARGTPWRYWMVDAILNNPKYAGIRRFGATSQKLGGQAISLPRASWLLVPAFEPLVSLSVYERAQQLLRRSKSNEEMLEDLRRLLAKEGSLSSSIIRRSEGTASYTTYFDRFGSLRNAFELIGYRPDANKLRVTTRLRHQALQKAVMARLVAFDPGRVSIHREHKESTLLVAGRAVSIGICRLDSISKKGERRWTAELPEREIGRSALLCLMDHNDREIDRMFLIDRLPKSQFAFRMGDPIFRRALFIDDLEQVVPALNQSECGQGKAS